MGIRVRIALAVGVLMLAAAPGGRAATVTTTMPVSATVDGTCTVSANPLAFGSYSGTALSKTTTFSVKCTGGTAYNVGLNAGTGSGATTTTRVMMGASGKLNYQLFQNTSHTTNWGDTVGTDTKAGAGSGANQSLTVYGLIPAGQAPPVGSYADTITVTVTY